MARPDSLKQKFLAILSKNTAAGTCTVVYRDVTSTVIRRNVLTAVSTVVRGLDMEEMSIARSHYTMNAARAKCVAHHVMLLLLIPRTGGGGICVAAHVHVVSASHTALCLV